jgi:formylglycine-generating enzyme required for sulfatase activity
MTDAQMPKAFDQQGQTVQGSQTNNAGNPQAPVLSGNFQGPVNVGNISVGEVHSIAAIGHGAMVGYTAEQVSALLTQLSATFQPKPFDGRCPYRGLEAFSEEDADTFFGREAWVVELVQQVKLSRSVVIAGPSGSGKSSLARAGLLHALQDKKKLALPNSDHWRYETLTPGRHPLEALARVTASLAGNLNAGQDIRDKGPTDATILHQWADIVLSNGRDHRLIIFVDQFEETFTQVNEETERVAFLNLLTHAATIEGGRVTVVFALRSDFISNCATYLQLNALLNQQFRQIGALQADELVSAIARPALQVGLRVDPDLIAQIIKDMHDEPGTLPLMQFALKDLFDAQQAAGGVIALTLDGYQKRGGLHKALERHADAAFAQLNESEQLLARDIFTGLVQIGRGTQDTRRTATYEELIPAGVAAARVEAVLKQLADARLITTDERDEQGKRTRTATLELPIEGLKPQPTGDEETRTRTATIAHERLIDAWPWLRKLVNENRETIALQNKIAEDAQEWERGGHDSSYLYGGARLAAAREQMAAQKLALNELALAFMDASIEAQEVAEREKEAQRQRELHLERRARRNLQILVAVLSLLVMGGGVFFIRLEILRQKARTLAPVAHTLGQTVVFELHEVSNERYALCVTAGQCGSPALHTSSFFTTTPSGELLPVTGVDAVQAAQFCSWINRRLPTQTEWEQVAARAPAPAPGNANRDFETGAPLGPTLVTDFEAGGTPEGILNLHGNVWEWTATASDDDGNSGPDWNGEPGEVPSRLIILGGGYNATLTSNSITHAMPTYRSEDLGFRCVEDNIP